ncbi:MAG TPA: hypothetical protein PLX97_04530, partial [Gemmatales bacterium]|nr:hypothetical protein [Gemmatales bacterium]
MWWILLGVVVLGGLFALALFLNNWQRKAELPESTVRHALTEAKNVLLNKEALPDIVRRMKDKTEIPFDAAVENKAKAEIPGTFVLRWPTIHITYSNKDGSEKLNIIQHGNDQKVALFYSDGVLGAVDVNKETLDQESFDFRHAGTLSDQLRQFVRYHVRFPGGSLKLEKAPEPTFKPVKDLRKGGEIHLKGPPPPGRMPNFEE